MKLRHSVALVVFGVGHYALQSLSVILGAVEPPSSESLLHFVRLLVLAPMDLIPPGFLALLPGVPKHVNQGLCTLMAVLAVNSLIWVTVLYLGLRFIESRQSHSENLTLP